MIIDLVFMLTISIQYDPNSHATTTHKHTHRVSKKVKNENQKADAYLLKRIIYHNP